MLEAVGRFGLCLDGVVHLALAGLALQIAWHRADPQADQAGALAKISEQPLGQTTLWAFVIGFLALAVMQLAILSGRLNEPHARDAMDRGQAGGLCGYYLVLGALAASYAIGAGGGGTTSDISAHVLGWPGGQLAVALVGLVVLGIAGYYGWSGITTAFASDIHRHDRAGRSGTALITLGRFGYLAKSIALGLAGTGVLLAAVEHDATDATGLDYALRTLAAQPLGSALLTVVAAGVSAFGCYLIAISRRGKL